jgi:hypothetical protein
VVPLDGLRPRRSITDRLVYGQVWRRHNGRRWKYKKFVELCMNQVIALPIAGKYLSSTSPPIRSCHYLTQDGGGPAQFSRTGAEEEPRSVEMRSRTSPSL